jgi:hypothetical protein
MYGPRYAGDLKEREEEFVSSIMVGATSTNSWSELLSSQTSQIDPSAMAD